MWGDRHKQNLLIALLPAVWHYMQDVIKEQWAHSTHPDAVWIMFSIVFDAPTSKETFTHVSKLFHWVEGELSLHKIWKVIELAIHIPDQSVLISEVVILWLRAWRCGISGNFTRSLSSLLHNARWTTVTWNLDHYWNLCAHILYWSPCCSDVFWRHNFDRHCQRIYVSCPYSWIICHCKVESKASKDDPQDL